jgi:hypothetical protein
MPPGRHQRYPNPRASERSLDFRLWHKADDERCPLTRSSASGSLRPFLIMSRETESWRSWGDLLHSVQTGQTAFEHVYGKPFFEYLAAHAEPAQIFDEAMASRSAAEIAAVLSVYDFSTVKQIVDVGGGYGALIKEVLSKFPNTYGVLYDLPHARRVFDC